MSLNDWIDAFHTYLISSSNEESISNLLKVVPFETICSCCIHPDANDDLRETAQRVTSKLITTQSISSKYIQTAFFNLICGRSDSEGGKKLMEFLKSLVSHDDEENKQLIKTILGQVFQVTCIANAYTKNEASNSANQLSSFILSDLLNQIMMPLFDHDQLSYSNVVTESLLTALSGEVLHTLVMPSTMGLQDSALEELSKRWHRKELTNDERDSFVDWILDLELIKELKGRIKGEIELKAGRSSSAPDVVRVRAGSLLIKLADQSSAVSKEAVAEDWMGLTINTLYRTDDVLLKLTAGELIIEELLNSETGMKYVWTSKLYLTCLADLQDETLDIALTLALTRLLSNIVEKVPEARHELLEEEKLTFLKTVRDLIDATPSDAHYITKKCAALSSIGCIASRLNVPGITALNKHVPEWITELELSLRSGTESELMAALMAVARILGGIDSSNDFVEKDHPLVQQVLHDFSERLSSRIVDSVASRPFPAPREVGFRLLTGFLSRGIRKPLEEFCGKIELQTLLFAPPYADPATVKYAKHEFVKVAVSLYQPWIKENCSNKDFVKALSSYANHDAFFTPDEYKGSQVEVADKFAE